MSNGHHTKPDKARKSRLARHKGEVVDGEKNLAMWGIKKASKKASKKGAKKR